MKYIFVLLMLLIAAQAHGHNFPVDGRTSGSWFDPDRDGEGWVIEVLDDGQVFVTWFTYPPGGSPDDQYWIAGVGTIVDNTVIVVEDAVSVRGARFGDDFRAEDVVRTPWGRFTMGFDTCNEGEIFFQGPPEFGVDEYRMRRITNIRGAECNGNALKEPPSLAARVATGAWFDPARSGEGWLIEDLGDGAALVYWFTSTPDGAPAWMIGVGEFADDGLWVDELLITTGTNFGDAFDPGEVDRQVWGSLHFTFYDCGAGRATWRSNREAYGEGMIDMVRLTSIDGLDCEPFPQLVQGNGSWSQLSSPMPTTRSEMVAAVADERAFVVGGFGGFAKMESYNPRLRLWSEHPLIPRGRNHHFAAAYRHDIYVFGGFRGEFFSPVERRTFVFRTETGQWEQLVDMPLDKATGYNAVTLGDRIYLVGGEPGVSVTYDPQTDTYSTFQGPPGSTDHSQAVGYRGELWVMGGRGISEGERNETHIFNPVSGQWRSGPPMNVARGGFGAAVVNGQIMVVGGEVVVSARRSLSSLEILDPASMTWVQGPSMPQALHGLAAASIDGLLYTFGGTIDAGGVDPAGLNFVYQP